MLRFDQVLLLDSDLHIVFGQQRTPEVALDFSELSAQLYQKLPEKDGDIFKVTFRAGGKGL